MRFVYLWDDIRSGADCVKGAGRRSVPHRSGFVLLGIDISPIFPYCIRTIEPGRRKDRIGR